MYDLEVQNLTKKYSTFALDHISFHLPEGMIMGLIGDNGAGKTTTLKLILGILSPDEGSVNLFGKKVLDEASLNAAKQNIGVVMDECCFHEALCPNDLHTILSKIYKNWDPLSFKHYLEEFDLPPKKTIKEFSRGMKMKLSIAAAMAHHPKLLLLDEATSGLDVSIRNHVLDVFQEYIQDGEHSILMSSHITSDLERICDYITYIQNGTLIFSEEKDRFLENHAILKCSEEQFHSLPLKDFAGFRKNSFGCEVLIHNPEKYRQRFPDAVIDMASLEDIMLLYKKDSNNIK